MSVPEREFPAIGLIELNSVARGIDTVDRMIKKAPVMVLSSMPICPGKYMILITGDEASVDESLTVGREVAESFLVDELFLPGVHPTIIPAISALTEIAGLEALGVVETFSVATAIVSADVAVKYAEVKLIELRLARGLAGKSFYTLTGSYTDVEAAVGAGAKYASGQGLLVSKTVIPNPHQEMNKIVL